MGVQDFASMTAGKRVAKRSRVLLAAKLRTDAGDLPVRLRDLSRRGALLEGNHDLAVDDEVVFARGATSVPARVAWTGGSRLGIEFLDEIDAAEVLVHVSPKSSKKAPAPTGFRRPRLASELTARQLQHARRWAASVGITIDD